MSLTYVLTAVHKYTQLLTDTLPYLGAVEFVFLLQSHLCPIHGYTTSNVNNFFFFLKNIHELEWNHIDAGEKCKSLKKFSGFQLVHIHPLPFRREIFTIIFNPANIKRTATFYAFVTNSTVHCNTKHVHCM